MPGSQKLESLKNKEIERVECYSAECFVIETDITEHVAFDMELHSIAILCDKYQIPVYSLKKISDNLDLKGYYENISKENIFELDSSLELLKDENII